MRFNPWKTVGKVGKNFGLLALGGALAALSPSTVAAILIPLGPYGPLIAILANAGLAAVIDWRKHANK
jgi:hypothetical protein